MTVTLIIYTGIENRRLMSKHTSPTKGFKDSSSEALTFLGLECFIQACTYLYGMSNNPIK